MGAPHCICSDACSSACTSGLRASMRLPQNAWFGATDDLRHLGWHGAPNGSARVLPHFHPSLSVTLLNIALRPGLDKSSAAF